MFLVNWRVCLFVNCFVCLFVCLFVCDPFACFLDYLVVSVFNCPIVCSCGRLLDSLFVRKLMLTFCLYSVCVFVYALVHLFERFVWVRAMACI